VLTTKQNPVTLHHGLKNQLTKTSCMFWATRLKIVVDN